MSYILEALKKSEKERKKEGVPDLQADHSLPPVRRVKRNPFGKLLIGVGGGILLTGGGWFWWQGQHEGLSQSSTEQQITAVPSISVSPEISQVPASPDSSPGSPVLSQEILVQISQEVRQAVIEAKDLNSSVAVAAVVADSEPALSEEKGGRLPRSCPLYRTIRSPFCLCLKSCRLSSGKKSLISLLPAMSMPI